MDRENLQTKLSAALFTFSPDPIFLLDADGVFLDLNDPAARYLGDDPARLIGRTVADLFPEEQARRQLQRIRGVAATGDPFVEERVTPIGDETYIFRYLLHRVEVSGDEPPLVLGMIRDITGLVALERRYLELYERATDSLFAVDTDGRIRALNREAETMSGYARDTVESLHFSEMIPPDEVERLGRYFAARVSGEDAPTEYEVRYLHASGEARWAEVHIARETSSVGAFQASVRDITERKRLEATRRDFLHMVSHDVKSPLTVIEGFAKAMAAGLYGETSAQQTECLERIEGAGRRVRQLMEQFLLAEQLDDDAWKAKPGPVSTALDRALAGVGPEAEDRGVSFDVSAGGVETLEVADAEGLECVLENLFTNALKFTGAGGRITVRASGGEGDVKVEVTDTGVGIPEPELSRLFDRFFRASNAGGTQGSGLGLYIVRRLVERSDGQVTVASRPGEGTRFTVVLPAVGA